MHVFAIIPYSSKKAVFGHKGYAVSISRSIFVARHLLLFPGIHSISAVLKSSELLAETQK
jgi:hypothetical protein